MTMLNWKRLGCLVVLLLLFTIVCAAAPPLRYIFMIGYVGQIEQVDVLTGKEVDVSLLRLPSADSITWPSMRPSPDQGDWQWSTAQSLYAQGAETLLVVSPDRVKEHGQLVDRFVLLPVSLRRGAILRSF